MIPNHESGVSSIRRTKNDTKFTSDRSGVSEVLGVIMMLAMVVSIMGGVWVFLNPYISDFEDKILQKCKSDKPEILDSISSSGKLEENIEKMLIDLINDFKKGLK